MSTKKDIIKLQDDVNRFISQAQAISSSLICDEHYRALDGESLATLIWIIDDRLEDIKVTQNKLFEMAKAGAS